MCLKFYSDCETLSRKTLKLCESLLAVSSKACLNDVLLLELIPIGMRGFMSHKGVPDFHRSARNILKDYMTVRDSTIVILYCILAGVDLKLQ